MDSYIGLLRLLLGIEVLTACGNGERCKKELHVGIGDREIMPRCPVGGYGGQGRTRCVLQSCAVIGRESLKTNIRAVSDVPIRLHSATGSNCLWRRAPPG